MTIDMSTTRTDLALESVQAACSGAEAGTISGVRSRERTREGYAVTDIRVEDEDGAQALGKPVGRYVTVDLGPYFRREADYFDRPGVLARTGLEALELVRGAVERVRPAAVIAVDALAARDSARLCATVQLSDTGLVPGSGVGNRRSALDRGTLGVPVIAVGIPTVVDADPRAGLFLTPRDIDQRIRELGRLLGYGITLALQPSLTAADVTALLG